MKFSDYLAYHETIYPRPAKKSLGLGWEFWAAIIVAVAAIILAALRTAHSFYIAAVLSAQVYGVDSQALTGILSYTEAASAMIAIEGGIVYGAVKRAQHNGKINARLFLVYIVMLVLISVVAGLGQSLGLILGLPETVLVAFSWVMAIILGAGASVVAWLSGEMLGVELLKYEEAKTNADRGFASANTRWLNTARTHWYAARKEEREAAKIPPRPPEPRTLTYVGGKLIDESE